ncbi:hypothetical protein ElyMa_001410700 [Elysia marginata]|uniref:Uncharacterized protein n=1 Tax=Elysia marginata TaxID=1093978 RepID=A0AAV4IV01_9GAST|nr:hypothetical protein ElyMa_001410700 [Elysia marginata]
MDILSKQKSNLKKQMKTATSEKRGVKKYGKTRHSTLNKQSWVRQKETQPKEEPEMFAHGHIPIRKAVLPATQVRHYSNRKKRPRNSSKENIFRSKLRNFSKRICRSYICQPHQV